MSDNTREFLRHIVATVAYRASKAIGDAPPNFADFKIGKSTKTPIQILSHMGDLYDWALSQLRGEETWKESETLQWNGEVERFFSALESVDKYLSSDSEIHTPIERLFQGPIADSLTHIGQIAMLRRLADSPVKAENYFKASVEIGRVGKDQDPPIYEFY